MGQMRFHLHRRDRIPPGGLPRIYVAGNEDIPWQTRSHWEKETLVVERGADESGYVYVPWMVDGHGQYLLGTSTLIERDRPYLLDVELARGLMRFRPSDEGLTNLQAWRDRIAERSSARIV